MAKRVRKSNGVRVFLAFAGLTFAISWAFWVPQAMLARGVFESAALERFFHSNWNIAPFGPTIAAVLVVLRKRGPAGLVEFLWSGLTARFRIRWLVISLFAMPLLCWLAAYLAPGAVPQLGVSWRAIPAAFGTAFLVSGPLAQEFGWRGLAQPRLQSRLSGLGSAVVIGGTWATWQLPLHFMTAAEGPQYNAAFGALAGEIITLTLLSVLAGWVYNATRGSVLITMLFLTSHNLSAHVLFPVFDDGQVLPFYTLLMALAATGSVLIAGPGPLGRKR